MLPGQLKVVAGARKRVTGPNLECGLIVRGQGLNRPKGRCNRMGGSWVFHIGEHRIAQVVTARLKQKKARTNLKTGTEMGNLEPERDTGCWLPGTLIAGGVHARDCRKSNSVLTGGIGSWVSSPHRIGW